MHNTDAHHLLTNPGHLGQLDPNSVLETAGQLLLVNTLRMVYNVVEYLYGQFRLAALDVFPPKFLYTCSLAEHRKLQSPWLGVSTAEQQCVISVILILNTKHRTVPATREKINSVPAESRTNREKHPFDIILKIINYFP